MKKIKLFLLTCVFLCASIAALYMVNEINIRIQASSMIATDYDSEEFEIDEAYLEEFSIADEEFELPVIMINTNDQQIFKNAKVFVDIAVINNPSKENALELTPNAVLNANINYRGASSYLMFDKPQYRIEFYEQDSETKSLDYDLLGMGAESEWVLNGPFLDKTLLRNYLMYNLSAQVMDWSPDAKFCELFVDGKYQGVYLVVEPITNGINRLNISNIGLLSGKTSFVVRRERENEYRNEIETHGFNNDYTSNYLSIDYPSINKITPIQQQWITNYISEFEEVLYSDEFIDEFSGYRSYIDTISFVDYFILNELAMIADAGSLSFYVYKDIDGNMKTVNWDFNNAFDNYQGFSSDINEFVLSDVNWYSRFLMDRKFVDEIVTRYAELRSGALSDDNIEKILSQGINELGDGVERNFAVWGYSFGLNLLIDDSVEDRDITNYKDAMMKLEDNISDRLDFMDNNINQLYEYCVN